MKTCLIDPGRVNRKIQHKYSPDAVKFGNDVVVQILVNGNGDWMRKIQIKDKEYEEKYCLECNIFRIEGMNHCRECNRCILEMDHHCIWFGNCVARNNIKHFHIYLYTLIMIILINIIFMYKILVTHLKQRTIIFLILRWCTFVMMLLYIFFFGIILSFTIFNIYIALCSSRSRDFIKGRMKNKKLNIKKACINFSTIRLDISSEDFSV